MRNRIYRLLVFVTFSAIASSGAATALAQSSVAEFQNLLREKTALDEADFAALKRGQTIVKLAPALDKREVAVFGVVAIETGADAFLQSFRENMTRKNDSAVLEIGRFNTPATLDDLRTLTIESRDIEDMKSCVVGDCQLKLSATMIERFRKDVNWQAPDYQRQATQLLKQLLVEYVSDYVGRGDPALIAYNDKMEEVRLEEEHRALMGASGFVNDALAESREGVRSFPNSELRLVENAMVWSKIKFGLKPVVVVNHIMIYRREQESGPQVLIASKQIYANHYFNSSLAMTAFVNIPGTSPGSYLVYENRSRTDGLTGAFGKMKRRIVEGKAVSGLKAILEHSKVSLDARTLSRTESAAAFDRKSPWRRWTFGGVHVFLWFVMIAGFIALFALVSVGDKLQFLVIGVRRLMGTKSTG